jgi:hypothetical protein
MESSRRVQVGTLIFVMATFGLDMYSALNSSPQTTEINASTRAATLMKWVYIGDAVALAGGVVAWLITGKPEALVGVAGVVVIMHYLYVHAKRSGLENGGPSTETTAPAAAVMY